MAIIKAELNAPDKPECHLGMFSFDVVGYADPRECIEHDYYQPGGEYGNWYYMNSNGYIQMYDANRPPAKHPSPVRLIVTPVFFEPPYLVTAGEAEVRRSWKPKS